MKPRSLAARPALRPARKAFHGPSDLAVNGAAPAFAEPLHVGRPNIGDQARFMQLMQEIFDNRWLSNNGPMVLRLEAAIAAHLGVKHCIAMCNGTIALEIAVRAQDLAGEVIVPSYTFIATAHALRWLGLEPIFADIDPVTHNLDPEAVRARITPRTSAILGVHLWGRPAPVDALGALAAEHGLPIFYDAAHAFSCSHAGRMIGGFGACEVLSFHATKFFNSFEGGAIVTNDDELAERARKLRNFGFAGLDDVQSDGTNGKMIEPAAAMGLVNLERIDETIAVNRRNHALYSAIAAELPGLSILPFDPAERNNYQYVVAEVGPELGAPRDAVVEALRAENVLARKYFWPGCHRMEPYRTLQPELSERLPNTHLVADRVVVLPTGEAVGEDDISVIGDIIRQVAR